MNGDVTIRTEVLMGTLVTIELLQPHADVVDRALEWFRQVETACTRFDERSELMQLSANVGRPVHASDLLFEAVRFALHVAAESGGAFDPTVGGDMMRRGFASEHRTRRVVQPPITPAADASYRDVELNEEDRTITLHRPLLLDLGAVAKGLAIDLAARELQPCANYAIDAGGDLYVAGHNRDDEPWSVGIRHPRVEGEVIQSLRVSDAAVCTSGDYERAAPGGHGHHIVDPRTRQSPLDVASVTVVAASAMLADALATAAFVLGPREGMEFFERMQVEALIVTGDLTCLGTPLFGCGAR